MNKNSIKIKQLMFLVIVGLVALGNFNTTFGESKMKKAKAEAKAAIAKAKTEEKAAKAQAKAEARASKAEAKKAKAEAKAKAKIDEPNRKKKHIGWGRTVTNLTPFKVSGTIKYVGCAQSKFTLAPNASFNEYNRKLCLVHKIIVNSPSNVSWSAGKVSGKKVASSAETGIKSGFVSGGKTSYATGHAQTAGAGEVVGMIEGAGLGTVIKSAVTQQGTEGTHTWTINYSNGAYSINMN